MADEEEPVAAAPVNAVAAAKFFKLPDFWTASPAAWFGVAEAQVRLRDISTQPARFSLLAAILPESAARVVAHLLVDPSETCYDDLKAALLVAHQLTSYQKAEKLFSYEPLGDRRPSQLLAEMMELVRPGEEKTLLFAMLFLRRLPPAVRILLTEDDHEDVRALAAKADRCAASRHNTQQGLSVHATSLRPDEEDLFEPEAGMVSALGTSRGSSRGRGGRGRPFRGGRQRSQQPSNTPAQLTRQETGLCRLHFKYGDQAYNCFAPCTWQGN